MSQTPFGVYRQRLAEGGLIGDPAQEKALEHLDALFAEVLAYRLPPPPAERSAGWGARLGFGRERERAAPAGPKGLYIFGEVGRGKSMLMDLFHGCLPEGRGRRLHFHGFMREAHATLHGWRSQAQGRASEGGDPIPRLARALTQGRAVLCLDEMDIQDIGDAMIVGRLFKEINDLGVVVVTTSNRAPDDLYKHGLQREKFLPFIALIKQRLGLVELAGPRDYRLDRMKGMTVYFTPTGAAADDWLGRCLTRLAGEETPAPEVVTVHGRAVAVRAATRQVGCFSFADLCAKPLGSHDYLAIAERFDTVLISDIPRLGPRNADEARRFVVLIDALYDHKTALICSAEAPPQGLYDDGPGAFEFQRTVSRLMEMQSEAYLAQAHV
ncbi:cell division protein ZapE [Rhodospirillum rubrum]|uniref:cell division protein ZapE n=1 Tax=Rhodospirillum rubrum TaxID=1085 RepID=UPI001906278D|nr:cell division protein ZapE [Rhodospirillum rubrum]MBK1666127.1 cell division protein ZapE [Rhodospirillum rubrum]MBK1678508.1 cell division protein ZapE [Rhodospirillum rubrum]